MRDCRIVTVGSGFYTVPVVARYTELPVSRKRSTVRVACIGAAGIEVQYCRQIMADIRQRVSAQG